MPGHSMNEQRGRLGKKILIEYLDVKTLAWLTESSACAAIYRDTSYYIIVIHNTMLLANLWIVCTPLAICYNHPKAKPEIPENRKLYQA